MLTPVRRSCVLAAALTATVALTACGGNEGADTAAPTPEGDDK